MTRVYRISIVHNFETAHRLAHPQAPTKCQSIHGHSWLVTVTIEGPELDGQGMLVEFGRFKKLWRAFLDDEVDHHLALKTGDPLIGAITGVMPSARILVLDFDPTTEQLAAWLWGKAAEALSAANPGVAATVSKVLLQETRVNSAEYVPS